MSLVPFSLSEVAIDGPLPFDVFDSHGRLLFRAGKVIASERVLEVCKSRGVYTTEVQYNLWKRALSRRVGMLIDLPGVTLADLARVQ